MDFEELAASLGIETTRSGRHSTEGWIQLDCPFCQESGGYHLGYNELSGACNCWKCGPHSLLSTLKEITGLPGPELKRLVVLLPRVGRDFSEKVGKVLEPRHVGPLQPCHEAYLRERDVSPEEAALWGLKGIGLAPSLAYRIYLPITLRGRTVSWTTRSIGSGMPRYISAPKEAEGVPHKTLLYGADLARHVAIVCEGPFDAIRIGPGAVATCGTAYSNRQVQRMAAYPVRAVCFDAEPVAQKRAEQLVDILSLYPGKTYNIQLESGDPGSASRSDVKRLRSAFSLDI